jgi:hypothetical protein
MHHNVQGFRRLQMDFHGLHRKFGKKFKYAQQKYVEIIRRNGEKKRNDRKDNGEKRNNGK